VNRKVTRGGAAPPLVVMLTGVGVLLAASLAAPCALEAQSSPPPQAEACAACHGPGGVSTNPAVPSLAGQVKIYLHWQLMLYRDKRRADPQMAPIAAALGDADMAALSAWFAAQRPAPGAAPPGDAARIEPGRQLAETYHCNQCHGRDFDGGERAGAPMSVVVNETFASRFFPGEDPIGRRVTLPLESKTALSQIVGIVGDVKQGELSEGTKPTVYQYSKDKARPFASFAVRTAVPPLSLGQAAAGVIRQLDAEQPVEEIKSMENVLEETLTSQRFGAVLLGLFAAVALLLASVGIYSVLSYIVRGRSREIGIRTALGAQPADVLQLVVREAMTPALIGVGAGVVAALASSRLMRNMVFGVSPSDPLTLTAVAATLTLVALLASVVPAYRAARLDPSEVLR